MEQKVVIVTQYGADEINKIISEGWRVTSQSGAANKVVTYFSYVLERKIKNVSDIVDEEEII